MLALPEAGMARSVLKHNVDRDKLCDWIEASAVFQADRLSKSDVIDVLVENEVYETQDFASEIVEDAWNILQHRINYLQSPLGIAVDQNRITRERDWKTFPAYGFCLALSCSELYPRWSNQWTTAPSVQGDIFEELTAESLRRAFGGWTIRRVGWSPENKAKLRTTIGEIISELNEVAGSEIDLYVDQHSNEIGLDVLAYFPYQDGVASFPVFMVQCASGKNWIGKRQTPDINIWRSVISFASHPVRGFAMPFAFASPRDFRKHAKTVDGMFIDRTRLLKAFGGGVHDFPAALAARLAEWTSAQLAHIPTDKN